MSERVDQRSAEILLALHEGSPERPTEDGCACAQCLALRDLLNSRRENEELRRGFARPATPESLGAERLARERAEARVKKLETLNEILDAKLDEMATDMDKLNARVKELEGALREIIALKWGAFGSSEPARIAERVLRGEDGK